MSIALFFAHRYYSNPMNNVDQNLFYEQIGYSKLQEDIISQTNVQAYFLCEEKDVCDYFKFTLLKPILNKYQLSYFSALTFVNMNDVSRQVSSTRLKELYNIQSVPAFILINTADASVLATLENSISNPLTETMIEEWFLTYGLIR